MENNSFLDDNNLINKFKEFYMRNSPELSSKTESKNRLARKFGVAIAVGALAVGAYLGMSLTKHKTTETTTSQNSALTSTKARTDTGAIESIQPEYAKGTDFERNGYIPVGQYSLENDQTATIFARCQPVNYQECLDKPFEQGSKKYPEIFVNDRTHAIVGIGGDTVSNKLFGITYNGPFEDTSTVPAGLTYKNSSLAELSQIMTTTEDEFPGAYGNGANRAVLTKYGKTIMTQVLLN